MITFSHHSTGEYIPGNQILRIFNLFPTFMSISLISLIQTERYEFEALLLVKLRDLCIIISIDWYHDAQLHQTLKHKQKTKSFFDLCHHHALIRSSLLLQMCNGNIWESQAIAETKIYFITKSNMSYLIDLVPIHLVFIPVYLNNFLPLLVSYPLFLNTYLDSPLLQCLLTYYTCSCLSKLIRQYVRINRLNLEFGDPEQTRRLFNIRGQQRNRFLGGLEQLQRQSIIYHNIIGNELSREHGVNLWSRANNEGINHRWEKRERTEK